ncbi:hypothetical protein [Legionella hackeliae]|uniref:Uncharacterized protein n=1 Tax=Legionella hackeliae TaxID=449 RepID=A0A0A8UNP9_LEGHA|nr:hypothetical protein [Legionella hackeliae]KTD13795.1 hypothetical protein Lhac_0639 [Legionella hackeliae]CEK10495.1 conserved protein of unknown function [Legionella hackeliae]STX47233.1 Uncharacterised protein [Legionella hackeliae]
MTIPKASSESLHNKNCYLYLKQLKLTESVLARFSPKLSADLKAVQSQTEYNPAFACADIYTAFFTEVEGRIDEIYDHPKQKSRFDEAQLGNLQPLSTTSMPGTRQLMALLRQSLTRSLREAEELDEFILSIYQNDNSILEETFNVIKTIPLNHGLLDEEIETSISHALKDEGEKVNKQSISPADAGSMVGRFSAMISDDFKPQHTTSLATIRHYGYTRQPSAMYPQEYRIGTQGQRDKGVERVSPLFERWLKIKLERALEPSKITHVYINNLGYDRSNAEGKKERALTEALHELEDNHPNIAVITLPADKGLMSGKDYTKTKDKISSSEAYDEFLSIATQDPDTKTEIKDFFISQKVRRQIFSDQSGNYSENEEKKQIGELLVNSFKAFGLEHEESISSAQKQAVWFHFIKFELTNHIIRKLDPESVNFSCKDAIDRGGVSSAYYNLLKSFETETPLNREEFEQALHAAPAMVKARGMNHHLKTIWNVVNAYVNANYEDLKNNKDKAWLIEWRDFNCPHRCANDLLTLRVDQSIQELNAAKTQYENGNHPKKASIEMGLKILTQIKSQGDIGVSGKRLLLEAAVRTQEIILHPEKANIQAYDALADRLVIQSPLLQKLAGAMKFLAGVLLYPFSLGYTQSWIKGGIATFKAGVESSQRKEIQNHMKEQLNSIKEDNVDTDESSVNDTQRLH